MDLKKLLALVLFSGVAFAWQYPGQYPPGQYPPGGYPGGYPGGQGTGIPIPHRTKKSNPSSSSTSDKAADALHFSGKLRSLDKKQFELDAADTRTLVFQINDQSKVADGLAVGDDVLVDAHQDDKGYYVALNVTRDTSTAPTAEKGSQKDGEKAASSGKSSETADSAPADSNAVSVERGPKYDTGDDGPPKLKRGKPAATVHKEPVEDDSTPVQTASATQPQNPALDERPTLAAGAPPPRLGKVDEHQAFIDKAREAAGNFLVGLPNYITQQHTTRYVTESHVNSWHAMDVVSVDVVFEGGKEKYANLQINGKPSKESPEESGAWSTGEFGTILLDLFSPSTAADFRYRRTETMNGFTAAVYDFSVERANSHWKVDFRSQFIFPAYKGTIWLDKTTARAVRIEMQAKDIPKEFPADAVENAVDYQMVSLAAGEKFLLPVQAEILSCERGTNSCSKNQIEFRNYHKYTGESVIKYSQ